MALESGTTLGHYEITAQIGKGGMGEVYRARDTKLGREVALKVLPVEFAQDEERLARLEREARMLAALNHPNIAAIYGLEQSDETRFLVLELVEGDTLADRLKTGPIKVAEALKLGLQIAEALEAAHDKGVIHRDLKPANIKVTPEGRVKVLDFGLAKAFIGDQADVNLSNSPTLSMAATRQGVILGTAAYMSPEQASGEVADHRADVWAFGVVLFEMLAGRQLFTGKTVSHVMGAVLERVPDWSSLPPNLHPLIRELLERCLEKDARNRRQTITDVRFDLQKVLADPLGVCPVAVPKAEAVGASKLPWVAAIVLTGVIALVAGWMLRPEPVSEPGVVARFPVIPPEGQAFPPPTVRMLDVSSDGRRIAYTANGQVLLRELDEMASVPIRGTGNNGMPTFSPDGQSLLYVEEAPFSIVKVPVSGGTPTTIFPGTGRPPFGLSWEVDDEILFVQPEGIMSIPPNGGDAQLVVAAEDGETLANPRRLPDGGGILFVSSGGDGGAPDWNMGRIFVHRDGGRTLVYDEGGSDARYVPTGHIVFARNTTLLAFPFDLGSMKRLGGPVPLLVEDLSRSEVTDTAQYAISDNGTLVQIQGTGTVAGARSLVWVDRNGDREPIDVPADEYLLARISPDGNQVPVRGRSFPSTISTEAPRCVV